MTFRIDIGSVRLRTWLANSALFAMLCVSMTYWLAQSRLPVANASAPMSSATPAPATIAAAASLFGGRAGHVLPDRKFQLQGVIVADDPADSVALMSSEGRVRVLPVNAEIEPGVRLAEVHPRHVMLAEGGALLRIDLPENAKGVELSATAVDKAGELVAGTGSGTENKPDMTRHLSRARRR